MIHIRGFAPFLKVGTGIVWLNIESNKPLRAMPTKSRPYEQKSVPTGFASIKDVDVETRTVTGYYASWETLDADNERFDPEAFNKSINEWGPGSAKERIKHLNQHNVRQPLGKPSVLRPDPNGLYFETEIIDTTLGLDVLKMYAAGLFEHSVGFRRVGEKMLDDDTVLITEAKLFEGSNVTWGANSNTPFLGFKSLDEMANHLSKKVSSLRYLLTEDLSDARAEQVELGLRQLESELIDLEERLAADDSPDQPTAGEPVDDGETPAPEEKEDTAIWTPPDVNFFADDPVREQPVTVSFFD